MVAVFLEIFPFFALIGVGYFAARFGYFGEEATLYLTKFVFLFALPAMLFRFGSSLSLAEIFDGRFVLAYWLAGLSLYVVVSFIGMNRNVPNAIIATEAQCAVFGNSGLMAIPMMVGLFGERAVPALMMILAVDLVFFGNLYILRLTIDQEGYSKEIWLKVLKSLLSNPMVMSMAIGLIYASLKIPVFAPIDRSIEILGAAATPCALFAIGAGLAVKSTQHMHIAFWLSFCKLVLHPSLALIFALFIFKVDPFLAGIMIGVAAMPTASNIYIIARVYNVASERVSATIFVSTVLSVLTLTYILGFIR